MADHSFGPLGRVSVAGLVVLSPSSGVDMYGIDSWPVSPELTGVIALLSAIGAVALWSGHDPTASERHAPRTR